MSVRASLRDSASRWLRGLVEGLAISAVDHAYTSAADGEQRRQGSDCFAWGAHLHHVAVDARLGLAVAHMGSGSANSIQAVLGESSACLPGHDDHAGQRDVQLDRFCVFPFSSMAASRGARRSTESTRVYACRFLQLWRCRHSFLDFHRHDFGHCVHADPTVRDA